MAVVNETLIPMVFEPLVNVIQSFVEVTSVLLGGGVFGLYLILIVLKWWQNRKMIHLLTGIQSELQKMRKNESKRKKRRVR